MTTYLDTTELTDNRNTY